MFIFNRKKHFDKTYTLSFQALKSYSLNMTKFFTEHSAQLYIAEDIGKFSLYTFLYGLYFTECVLLKKYYPKYKSEVFAVIDSLIDLMSKRMNKDADYTFMLYGLTKRHLDNALKSAKISPGADPLLFAANDYLTVILGKNKNDPNLYGVEQDIAIRFTALMQTLTDAL